MEISEVSSCVSRIRKWNTAADFDRSPRSHGQALARTFPPRACCVAGTSRSPLQLPLRRQDEFEPIRLSPLQPSPEAADVLPWEELSGSPVDLLKTAIDLLPPDFLDAF